jgi:phosphomannomutase
MATADADNAHVVIAKDPDADRPAVVAQLPGAWPETAIHLREG